MLYIIISIVIFMIAVLVVKEVKRCSLPDAVHICTNYLKEIFLTLVGWESQPQAKYPVHVGFDGYQIIPRLADVEWEEVEKSFPVCYCDSFTLTEHNIQYLFPLVLPDQICAGKDRFEQLIQKKAERCVADHLKQYGCYIPAEPLTVIEIFDGYMLITLAQDQQGAERIMQIKRLKRKNEYLKQEHTNPDDTFTERWTDGGE